MANVDPARYANEEQALHQHFPDHYEPRPPRKRRIRALVNLVLGKQARKDR
jgi:hypothetical protein